MAIDYTQLPTGQQVLDLLAASGITPATITANSDLMALKIASAASWMDKESGRQFVAGEEDEVRDYDGSGTGRQQIDDYVSVEQVEFFYYAPTISSQLVTSIIEVEDAGFPKNKLYINQGMPFIPTGYIDRFPQGRRNIRVTGQFGYGAIIPADVWEAILELAAASILDAEGLTTSGKLEEWKEADVMEKYGGADGPLSNITGWRKKARATAERYRRTNTDQARRKMVPLW